MFHIAADASKVALCHLVDVVGPEPDRLLDVQWLTDHLRTLGVVEIQRTEYLARLNRALALPLPVAFTER